ncbi:MAG: deaminase [Oscillospiraceae bacterium]|nr:deaminase [Oscillospiraceae bacterium]
MGRTDKENYYLDIAEAVLVRGTCLRRNYGAIIVANDVIVSTGYCGAPRGRANCCDLDHCERQRLGVLPGERYELCRSVHAEANAIIAASRESMLGSTMYLVGHDAVQDELLENTEPCPMCRRLIINAGISRVIIRIHKKKYKVVSVADWILDESDRNAY